MLQNLGFASVTSCTSFCENIRLETGERARILRLFFFRAILLQRCAVATMQNRVEG